MNGNTTHDSPTATQRLEQLDSITQRLHDGTLCARQLGELANSMRPHGWKAKAGRRSIAIGTAGMANSTSSHATKRESSSSSKSNQADAPLRHSAGSRDAI